MLSKDRHERLKQVVKLLAGLSDEKKYTKQLLKDLGDFKMFAVLKYCEDQGLVERKKGQQRKTYNKLTSKGIKVLEKYIALLNDVT